MRRTAVGILALALVAGAMFEARAGIIDSMIKKRKEGTDALDLSGDRAEQAKEFVKAKNVEALKGVAKVVIPFFQIEFAVENKASSGGNKVNARLAGIAVEDMAKIADDVYDDLVAKLGGMGIEVLPQEALKGSENYMKMEKRFESSPVLKGSKEGQSLFFSAHGMPVYFRSNDQRLAGFSSIGNSFTTVHPQNYEPRIGKDLGAAVLRVRLCVDIAKQSASKYAISTKPELAVVADWSLFEFLVPDGGDASFSLTKYVNMEAQPLEVVEKKDDGMPPLDLSGLGGPSVAATMNLKTVYATTPEEFTAAVKPNLIAVIDMFLEAAKAGR